MRRLLIPSLFLFLLPSCAFAQSVRYQSQVIGSRGTPLAFQFVAVCTQPANTTTTPCSTLATLATSNATTSGGTNPFLTDINGNFFFYAAPGRYTIQIYGPAIATPFVQPDTELACPATGPCTITGVVTLTSPVINGASIPSPNLVVQQSAVSNLTAQTANVGTTTLLTPAANGYYRVSCYTVVTQAATTSSTLPSCTILWTDADSSVAQSSLIVSTSSANTVGTIGPTNANNNTFFAKSGAAIQFATSGYASVGGTVMQYAVHVRVEGPF
jgi:hypothetical protein